MLSRIDIMYCYHLKFQRCAKMYVIGTNQPTRKLENKLSFGIPFTFALVRHCVSMVFQNMYKLVQFTVQISMCPPEVYWDNCPLKIGEMKSKVKGTID